MSDRYYQFATSGPGQILIRRLGLPNPAPLRRHRPGDRVIDGSVLLGGAPGGRLLEPVGKLLAGMGVGARTQPAAHTQPAAGPANGELSALVFDASGIADSTQLKELHAFFNPVLRSLGPCGRILVLGIAPQDCAQPRQATAQRALEGFVRSAGKEIKRGSTASLVYVTLAPRTPPSPPCASCCRRSRRTSAAR
jgi:3-oxoacyl-[acyl-carrier protein] reductase